MPAHDDVAFLHRLADAADAVSRHHFRSEALRTTTKVDGTPVSEVDRAVEEAMLALVRARGTDSVLGEEVGNQPGSSNRQWILDGIDGTHNYADGRPGWGTIIALDVDGTVELGMVSAPLWGRRWWAVRGEGAWSAPYAADGSFDVAAAEPLRCGLKTSLADASTIVIPWEGLLLGWRNVVPRLFHLPESIRSQCFALDAAMVAEGTLDASIIVFGGIWDFAATSLIVRESGGVFRDAWGGERLDTATGVFTNAALIDDVLAEACRCAPARARSPQGCQRPSAPPSAHPRNRRSTRGGGSVSAGWRRCRRANGSSRHRRRSWPSSTSAPPNSSGRCSASRPMELCAPACARSVGRKVDTRPIADAASAFLQALTHDQRAQATFPMDAPEWRMWINVHMNHFRHGVMLEDSGSAGARSRARDRPRHHVGARVPPRSIDHARQRVDRRPVGRP